MHWRKTIGTITMTWCLTLGVFLGGGWDHAAGGDWKMWGGSPGRNMVSRETGIPNSFEPGESEPDSELIDLSTTKNVKWVAKMGSQTYGNPTIANGRVYVGTNNDGREDPRFPGDRSLLKCLSEETGKVIWTLTVPKLDSGKINDWEYLGIASSPIIEEDRVYLVSNRCEVLCLDADGMADGNDGFKEEGAYMANLKYVALGKNKPLEVKPTDADIIWRFDMREKLGVFPHNITSNNLLITGNLVWALTSNGVDQSHVNIPNPTAPILIALDKMTGELKGEEASGLSERIFHSAWSSSAYANVNGQETIILGGPDGVLYGFDAKPIPDPQDPEFNILKELWRYDANPPHYRYKDGDRTKPIKYIRRNGPSEIIATPVVYEGKIYAAIGQDPEHGEGKGNMVSIDPSQTTEKQWIVDGENHTFALSVWEFDKIDRAMSTAAIHKGLVYVADFTGFIYCIDAETGKQYWKHDTLSHIWGSPLVVDGKLFIGTEDGDLIVLATGKEQRVINTITLSDSIYSSPVAANGTMYVTTQTQLYAIQAKD